MRLTGYDYRRSGYYFVTICVKSLDVGLAVNCGGMGEGDVLSNTPTNTPTNTSRMNSPTNGCGIELTTVGVVVADIIKKIYKHSENVTVDEWVVMPDHVHLLLNISSTIDNECEARNERYYSTISPQKNSLGVIVRQFKATVTGKLRKMGYQNFKWQRNYYDHIVRNREELNRICKYIRKNPQKLLEAQKKENSKIRKP